MKTSLVALVVALGGGLAVAGTSTWVKGSTAGWNSESSWTGGIPGSGDTVEVPAGTDLPVGDGDVDLAGAVAAVELMGADSTITFSLTERECTMAGSITGAGSIVKDGTNVVRFTATPKDSYYARGGIRVLAGEVYYPQTFPGSYSGEYMHVGPVYVAAGATLHPYFAYRVTVMESLTGEGTVMNKENSGGTWPVRIDSKAHSAFAGQIISSVRLQVNAPFDLLNPENSYSGDTSIYNVQADLGVMTFGLDNPGAIYGTRSSLGRNRYSKTSWNALSFSSPGRVRFLGEHDRSDRWIGIARGVNGVLDAGAGQLELFGKVYADSAVVLQPVLTLAGSNTVEASVLDADWEEPTDTPIYLAKKGTGAWLVSGVDAHGGLRSWLAAGASKRWNTGVVAVEEGTLRVDALAETNVPCSLGLSTRLYQKTPPDLKTVPSPVDYAVLLGSADAEGTLEYVGTNFYDNAMSTRPIAVTGRGGRIVASVPNRMTGFRGAFAADADGATLTLDGNGTTNYFYDISDRHGPMSVAKEGAGTWILGGDQTFSGKLEVKEGELVVSSTLGKTYEWYRFTVRQTYYAYLLDPTKTPSANECQFRIREMAIYDAAGNRLNSKYAPADANVIPAPGQITSWNPKFALSEYYKEKYGADNYGRLTDERTDWYLFLVGYVSDGNHYTPAIWDRRETWIPFVFHMKEGSARAASYDAVSSEGCTYAWSLSGYTMEASADGVFWDLVSSVKSNDVAFAGGNWISDNSAFTANAKRHGIPFGLDDGKSLQTKDPVQTFGAGGVSVAPGAVLRAEGAVGIPALEIDVNGAGTLRGFTMAEGGTVNLVGLDRLESAVELPLVFDQVGGTENFAEGWNVTVNGRKGLARLAFANGRLTAIPSGLAIIVR